MTPPLAPRKTNAPPLLVFGQVPVNEEQRRCFSLIHIMVYLIIGVKRDMRTPYGYGNIFHSIVYPLIFFRRRMPCDTAKNADHGKMRYWGSHRVARGNPVDSTLPPTSKRSASRLYPIRPSVVNNKQTRLNRQPAFGPTFIYRGRARIDARSHAQAADYFLPRDLALTLSRNALRRMKPVASFWS
jgi:hypothetical protein